MHQINFDGRSLRSTLLLGAASMAAVGLSAPAFAQDQSAETVVVTGSRIPQQGLYAPSPVTAVGQQELKFEGTVGVETLLNNLPAVFANQTAGVSNGASGTATVDLRDLGTVRTLVLVNGTRLMPGDPLTPAADLNTVPAALVDHVEVLTGGASAVYGSDAMAGVVNFIMRKDFEGIEFDGQYGIDEADNTNANYRALIAAPGYAEPKEGIWDGGNVNGTLIMGTNTANGKGNVTAYIGYSNTEAVFAGARDFGACTFGDAGYGHVCAGSSNYDRWISLDNSAAHIPSGFFETGTGAPGSGTFVPFTGAPSQEYNFGALNYLQRPDTRYNGGFFSHYEVNKELDIYASFMFTDDYTVAEIAPSGLFLGTGTINGADVQVNCSNPLMTAQENKLLCGGLPLDAFVANPLYAAGGYYNGLGNLTPGQSTLEIGRRDIEGGDRLNDLRHTSYRMSVGARGDLGDGWSYDVYAQYGYTIYAETYLGEFSKSRVQSALQVNYNASGQAVCASGSPCVPLNIFNGIGSITPAMLDYVGANGLQNGYTEEQIVSGNITGDLGEYGIQSPLAKSPVAVSAGTEYRAEYLQDLVSDSFAQGNPPTTDLYGQGGATPDRPRAGFNVVEGFGETKIPLVQEKPFVEDLSANAGYRYSSYSTAGSVSAYKYGLEYQAVDDFRLRASYERAVRAPNVLELFSPTNVGLFSGQDPCATSTAGQCATVPNAGSGAGGLLECPANQCNQQTGGNVNLRPEIGDTRTAGIVLTPTFLDGFTATIDYFDIDVSHAIGTVGSSITLAQCYGPTATAGTEAFFCPLVHRNVNGQIYGGGFVQNTDANTGFRHTKGFDFEANYNLDLNNWDMTSGWGAVQFAFVGTWLQSFEVEPLLQDPGLGHYDCAGLFGVDCGTPLPKWRHRLRVTWETPWDVDFSANWRYLSGVSLDTNQSNPLLHSVTHNFADATIDDFWYLDLAADWNVRTGVDLHAGVNNVFDRLPPGLASGAIPTGVGNDNTFPGTYDSLGRTMFIGATIKY
ncbi:MAG TPA: TonB-dependent receptor [Rhizomicrobium sp.]|nr:TonB-dependent receptor [Rhizomicrobium sp.]